MLKMCLSEVKVSFSNKEVLRGINCTLKGGNVTSIIGPNGTGKTTLIRAISKMIDYKGSISIKGKNGEELPLDKIAYVPQMSSNNSDLTVFEMVLLGQIKELGWKVTKEQLDATKTILEEMELIDLSYNSFSKLSGGQRQLVIMAQALVSKPDVLLLDEPTSALDIRHQLEVLDIAKKYTKQHNVITVVVIHDLALAARYSDEIMLLNEGYVLKIGNPKEVLDTSLLESVYKVKIDVSHNKGGFITVTPTSTIKSSIKACI